MNYCLLLTSSANLNPENATDAISSILSVLKPMSTLLGVLILLVSVFRLIMAFRLEDADSTPNAISGMVIAMVMIGMGSFIIPTLEPTLLNNVQTETSVENSVDTSVEVETPVVNVSNDNLSLVQEDSGSTVLIVCTILLLCVAAVIVCLKNEKLLAKIKQFFTSDALDVLARKIEEDLNQPPTH